MPVYVTRAHVTIGDSHKKDRIRSSQTKRPFQVSDICNTPYCVRTFCVSLAGLFVVVAGFLMTILGYRPEILIPGLVIVNVTGTHNKTETSPSPQRLELAGLHSLVYIGPVLMGIGFFSMMMAIVLFCEIKDRYFTNIAPKQKKLKLPKDHLYDMIIAEFRKNYFRGIEVPLKKPEKRHSNKKRFSFSLSRTGSSRSSGRRHSQDSARRKTRKNSRDSCHSVKLPGAKPKRSTLRRLLDPDSWMKTASLPNIRHREDFVELHDICDGENKTKDLARKKRTSQSCGPHLEIFKISKGHEHTGVDNPAYRDSPTDKKKLLQNQESIDTSAGNTHVTTVLIHRESLINDDIAPTPADLDFIPPSLIRDSLPEEVHGSLDKDEDNNGDPEKRILLQDSIIDIDRDITLIPSNEDSTSIPSQIPPSDTGPTCACGDGVFCDIHTPLGMDSDSSSLSLSWDGVPCKWNNARRNTEPMFSTYPCLCKNVNEMEDQPSSSEGPPTLSVDTPVVKSKSPVTSKDYQMHSKSVDSVRGPFRTCIGVFRSDSNIPKPGPYTLLRQNDDDSLSLDSLDLTEEMLKNFEIAEMAYI